MNEEREPQPSDGPDYHAEHAAWARRRKPMKPAVTTGYDHPDS